MWSLQALFASYQTYVAAALVLAPLIAARVYKYLPAKEIEAIIATTSTLAGVYVGIVLTDLYQKQQNREDAIALLKAMSREIASAYVETGEWIRPLDQMTDADIELRIRGMTFPRFESYQTLVRDKTIPRYLFQATLGTVAAANSANERVFSNLLKAKPREVPTMLAAYRNELGNPLVIVCAQIEVLNKGIDATTDDDGFKKFLLDDEWLKDHSCNLEAALRSASANGRG